MYMFPTLRDLLDTSHLFFLQTITSSKHHFLNFFCVSGTHWGLAPSLCSRFPTLHWISSVALPPFATWSMYTHSRCPRHLMISPLTGMLMDVVERRFSVDVIYSAVFTWNVVMKRDVKLRLLRCKV